MNSNKISSRDHLPSKNTMKSKGTTPTDNLTLEKMFASHMDSMRYHQTDASARVVARNRGHHRRMDLRCFVEDDESFRHLMPHPFHATRVQKRNDGAATAVRFVTVGGPDPLTDGETPRADVPSSGCYRHYRSHIVFC